MSTVTGEEETGWPRSTTPGPVHHQSCHGIVDSRFHGNDGTSDCRPFSQSIPLFMGITEERLVFLLPPFRKQHQQVLGIDHIILDWIAVPLSL